MNRIPTGTPIIAMCLIVLGISADAAVVGSIDPLNKVTLGTTTGGTQISLADMRSAITAVGNLTLAGVLDAETTTAGSGDFSLDPDYGTLQIGITGASRYTREDNTSVPTSGTKFGWINVGPETWNLTAPIGGRISHFGLTVNAEAADRSMTVLVNFSGGGSDTYTTTAAGHHWIGFVAPNSESITSVTLTEAGTGFRGYDDVSFVAVPEPSMALMAGLTACLFLCHRRPKARLQ